MSDKVQYSTCNQEMHFNILVKDELVQIEEEMKTKDTKVTLIGSSNFDLRNITNQIKVRVAKGIVRKRCSTVADNYKLDYVTLQLLIKCDQMLLTALEKHCLVRKRFRIMSQ